MFSKVKETPWEGEPLPRGRHKLPTKAVRASQRDRIARAMLECVAARGYERTTVAEVVRAAHVSRGAFYEFFTDKADCFLTTLEEAGNTLLADVLAAGEASSWTAAVWQGTEVYLRSWQEQPSLSRAYFLGLTAVGDRGAQLRERAYGRFAAMFTELGARARVEQPGLDPLHEIVPRTLVFAITELVADELRAGRGDRLVELQAELCFLIVKLLADDATARAATS